MSLRAKRSEVKQSQGLWELYTLLHSKVYLRLPTYLESNLSGIPKKQHLTFRNMVFCLQKLQQYLTIHCLQPFPISLILSAKPATLS